MKNLVRHHHDGNILILRTNNLLKSLPLQATWTLNLILWETNNFFKNDPPHRRGPGNLVPTKLTLSLKLWKTFWWLSSRQPDISLFHHVIYEALSSVLDSFNAAKIVTFSESTKYFWEILANIAEIPYLCKN